MVLSGFPIMLLSLFITDMADMFGLEVGVMGVVRSVSEIGSVVMGLLLSGLSVKYSQKSLLAVGIAIMCVSTLALGVVSIFPLFLVLFALFGFSKVTLRSMSNALVGQFYSVENRPKIATYLSAGLVGGYITGSTLAVYLPDFQLISLLVLFPLSVVTIIIVVKGMPSAPSRITENPLRAFRQVFGNRSAVMCLLGNALSYLGPNPCYLTFFIPFFLQTFQADRAVISMHFMIGCILMVVVASTVAGRLIIRFGRKRVTVVTTSLLSVFCFTYMSAPIVELSLIFWYLTGIVLMLYVPAINSLALEQLPEYRGTMMSLNLTSQFIAQAIGSALGGLILIVYGFSGLALFSLTGIISGILYQFFTVDPTREKLVEELNPQGGEQ
jgi:predicted MFS family arabinose efflux permease